MAAAKITPVQVPANAPYLDPVVSQDEAWAIKAFCAGKASEGEQGIVWRFIVGILSRLQSLGYYPDACDTAFIQGRRYVGHNLLRIAQMDPGEVSRLKKFAPASGGEDDEMPKT